MTAALAGTGPATTDRPAEVVVEIRDAALRFGERTVWQHLDLSIAAGEFIAVLGANGSGKTSLLRAILGMQHLSHGKILLDGERVRRGDRRIGYLPQQRPSEDGALVRGVDLVSLGLSGHRWGLAWPNQERRAQVRAAIEAVGAESFAGKPIGVLSGGEQQRIRVAQALVGQPELLLCDEPLASLDLNQQRIVSELIDDSRRRTRCGVLFITHDVNPVLDMVDRVVYLAGGQVRVGTVDEIFTADVLSEMYRTPVDVIRARGRIVVVVATARSGVDQVHHDVHGDASHHAHGAHEAPRRSRKPPSDDR